jgi:hypothetical protein
MICDDCAQAADYSVGRLVSPTGATRRRIAPNRTEGHRRCAARAGRWCDCQHRTPTAHDPKG